MEAVPEVRNLMDVVDARPSSNWIPIFKSKWLNIYKLHLLDDTRRITPDKIAPEEGRGGHATSPLGRHQLLLSVGEGTNEWLVPGYRGNLSHSQSDERSMIDNLRSVNRELFWNWNCRIYSHSEKSYSYPKEVVLVVCDSMPAAHLFLFSDHSRKLRAITSPRFFSGLSASAPCNSSTSRH